MIDFNKPLTTRDGAEVMIYFKHEKGTYPIHGAYIDGDGIWEPVTWTREGKFYEESSSDDDLDLVNVKEEFSIPGFVNVYDNQLGSEFIHLIHPTRESADVNTGSYPRMACIPILLKGIKGEGL